MSPGEFRAGVIAKSARFRPWCIGMPPEREAVLFLCTSDGSFVEVGARFLQMPLRTWSTWRSELKKSRGSFAGVV
jgi:hypothetical protein